MSLHASNRLQRALAPVWMRLFRDRRGVSAVEYALLLGAILIAVAVGYRTLGGNNALTAKNATAVLMGGGGGTGSSGSEVPGSGGTNGNGTPNDPGSACPGGVCSAPGSCFVAGTPVATPSGDRPIESLAPGDLVFARGELDDAVTVRPVLTTYVRPAPALVDVHLANVDGEHEVVRSTPEHLYFTQIRAWTAAGDLAPGETLIDRAGREVRVTKVVSVAQEAAVYNFEVGVDHTYFVGRSAVWVHNPPGCEEGNPPQTGPVPPTTPATTQADKENRIKDSVTNPDGSLIGKEDSTGVRLVPKETIQDVRANLTRDLGPPKVTTTPKGTIETWTISTDPKSTVTYRSFSSSGGMDDPTIDFNNVNGLGNFKRLHAEKTP
ncbi:polymorphic toxin-type HINT domain-containing protein [Pendulispora albinea]|uniref:Hint domain-containing protein n=1 Tax=Pendulispora albinea TaxID=2741071 RepID=A0ABZ2LZX1_9BACT